jgi:hypothetical protein
MRSSLSTKGNVIDPSRLRGERVRRPEGSACRRHDIRELWRSPTVGLRWQQRMAPRPPTRCKTPRFRLEARWPREGTWRPSKREPDRQVAARGRPCEARLRHDKAALSSNRIAALRRPRSLLLANPRAAMPRGQSRMWRPLTRVPGSRIARRGRDLSPPGRGEGASRLRQFTSPRGRGRELGGQGGAMLRMDSQASG